MLRILALFFAFTAAHASERQRLDLGPVLPEHEAIVKEIEKLTCAECSKFQVKPYSECERLRVSLRGTFATIRRDNEKFEEENRKLTAAVSSNVNIDEGAQCAVGQLKDQAYAHVVSLEKKLEKNIHFAKTVHEGLGPKPWKELREYRAQIVRMKAENHPRFVAAEAELRQLSVQAGKSVPLLKAAWEKVSVQRRMLRKSHAELAKKYSCVREKEKESARVKAASSTLVKPEQRERGTGFVVKTIGADGKEHFTMVTAHHVAAPEVGGAEVHRTAARPSADTENQEISPKAAGQPVPFAVEPGRYDRGNDLITAEVPPQRNALEVVKPEEKPQLGQEFLVSGQPGYAGSEYTTHTCTFVGFGASRSEQATHYYMECPSAVTHQGGISGGAVTDRSGRVWGVASSHGGAYDLIRVAPISAGPGGQVQFGIQQTFVTNDCFQFLPRGNYRCQIIPGYGWSNTGP